MKKIITEEKLVKIFQFLAIVLFATLFLFSFVSSWVNDHDLTTEYVFEQRDSLLYNALWLGILLLGGVLLYRSEKYWKQKINMDIVAVVICILAGIFSVYWIGASAAVPQADQLILVNCAEEFENGNYESLAKGQYIGIYRQQLGLVTFIRLLYKIFGEGNYQVFQYLNALMVPVLIFSGYQIVKKLTANSKVAELFHLLFMATCVPLYCYVPFVYGEIMSTTLVVFAAWMLLWSFEKFSPVKVVLLSVALGAAVQIRSNTLIFLIAFILVLLIRLLRGVSRSTLITLAGIVLCVVLFQACITHMYAKLVPEDSCEAPASLWVAMGVNDDNGMAGWHNYYIQIAFAENDYNIDRTNRAAKEDFLAFLATCKDNPGYAADFYYRKISSQWNAPMYQGLAMNDIYEGERSAFAEEVYYGSLRDFVEAEMNIYQLVMYGGILGLLILNRKKWNRIDNYLLLIAIFGGFLFSVIWEAKTRYVLPYFLVMMPYAAAGVYEIVKRVSEKTVKQLKEDVEATA